MTMRPSRSDTGLFFIIGWSLLALAIGLLPIVVWVRAVVWIPLVFVMPGYALIRAVLPKHSIPLLEGAVYTLAGSVSIVALTGVLLQLVLPVDRQIWAIAIVTVAVIAGLAATLRRGRETATMLPLPAPILRISIQSTLTLALALGLVIGAVVLASAGARSERATFHFTELWVLSVTASLHGSLVDVGVRNHQGDAEAYVVRVNQGRILLGTSKIHLADGQLWQKQVACKGGPSTKPVTVTLLHHAMVYHYVRLERCPTPS